MDYYRNYEELEKAIKNIKKNKDIPLPLLVFFYKEKENIYLMPYNNT